MRGRAPTLHALLLLTAAALVLPGCSAIKRNFLGGEDNREKPAELEELATPAVGIETLWTEDVGSGTDDQYLRLSPAVAEGRVFVAETDGNVAAYEADTGKLLWRHDTEVTISGGPGTNGDMVVVGSDNGDVVAVLAGGGDRLWHTRVSSEVLATPRIAEGIVVIRTIDGKLFGLDARTGARRWIYDRSVPVLTLRGTSAPAVSRGLAVGGFDSGRLVAVDVLDGQTVWEARLALPSGRSELERLVDIDAEPVIEDNTVYAVTYQGRLAALDLLSGDVLWRRDMSSHTGLTLDSDNVYVTDDNAHVWALDRINSSSVWRQQKLAARDLSGPAVAGGYVVVGDFEGYVHWLDRRDGSLAARLRLGSKPIIAAPIAADGVVFVYSSDGTLAAYRTTDGG